MKPTKEKAYWVVDYYNALHTYTFGYCTDPDCKAKDEHDWRFDGQIFYPKVSNGS